MQRLGRRRSIWIIGAVVVIVLVAGLGLEQRNFFFNNAPAPTAHQARIDKLESMGFSPELADYVASSNASLLQSNSTFAEFLVALPSNLSADVSYTIIPNQTVLPTQADLVNSTNGIYNLTISTVNASTNQIITLSYYFVNSTSPVSTSSPSSSIPASIVDAGNPVLSIEATPNVRPLNGGGGVVHEGSVVFHVLEKIKVGLNTALALAEGYHIYHEFGEWYNQLLSLEECAQNPTNPLTISGYEQDPGQKQQILDAISAAKFELQELSIARLLNLAVGLSSDLVSSQFLDIAVLFAEKYSESTLKDLSEELVKSIQKMVTPCSSTATTSATTANETSTVSISSLLSESTIPTGTKPGAHWSGEFQYTQKSSSVSSTLQVDTGTFTFTLNPNYTLTGSGSGTQSNSISGACTGNGSTSYTFPITGGWNPQGNVSLEPGSSTPVYNYITETCSSTPVPWSIPLGFYPVPATLPLQDGETIQGTIGGPDQTYKITIHGAQATTTTQSSSEFTTTITFSSSESTSAVSAPSTEESTTTISSGSSSISSRTTISITSNSTSTTG